MMRKLHFILPFAIIIACLCSCNGDIFPTFVANDAIHIEVNGETILKYDELTCQLGFNRDRHQFRMCTDNMSDYFSVTMSMIPNAQGDNLKADLIWTTKTDVITRKNVALEVVKAEGDKFWLWNEQGRIALVIQILD